MILKQIGERVRQARTRKGMTQAQLAEALEVSAHFLSNIEQGKQAMNVLTLSDICETLDVSADWILRDCTPEAHRITESEIVRKLQEKSPAEKSAMLRLINSLEEILKYSDL